MGSSPLDLYSRDYLNSLNSLAMKISTDIATAVAAYEDLWHTLSGRDQNQIVNETIIYPEVVLQYSLYKTSHDSGEGMCPEEKPKNCREFTGEGETEKGASWRDEHGAPFSWMTRSQLDLRIPSDGDLNIRKAQQGTKVQSYMLDKKVPISECDSFIDPPNIVLGGSLSHPSATEKGKVLPESGSENDNLLSKLKGKTVCLKIQPMKMIDVRHRHEIAHLPRTDLKEKERMCPAVSCKSTKGGNLKHISKPKNPPPPPPKKKHVDRQSSDTKGKVHFQDSSLQFQESSRKQNNTTPDEALKAFEDFHVNINEPVIGDLLPKTGFDFLDNW